jgi:hypothetical protein
MIFRLNTTHKKCRQQKCNVAVHGLKLEIRKWGEMKRSVNAYNAILYVYRPFASLIRVAEYAEGFI